MKSLNIKYYRFISAFFALLATIACVIIDFHISSFKIRFFVAFIFAVVAFGYMSFQWLIDDMLKDNK